MLSQKDYNDTWVLRVDRVVGDVEGFAAPQVVVRHGRGLLPLDRSSEADVAAFHESVKKYQLGVTKSLLGRKG